MTVLSDTASLDPNSNKLLLYIIGTLSIWSCILYENLIVCGFLGEWSSVDFMTIWAAVFNTCCVQWDDCTTRKSASHQNTLGSIKIHMEFQSNLPSSCRDLWLWTKVLDWLTLVLLRPQYASKELDCTRYHCQYQKVKLSVNTCSRLVDGVKSLLSKPLPDRIPLSTWYDAKNSVYYMSCRVSTWWIIQMVNTYEKCFGVAFWCQPNKSKQ